MSKNRTARFNVEQVNGGIEQVHAYSWEVKDGGALVFRAEDGFLVIAFAANAWNTFYRMEED